jgi:hyperosmotically inducible periplasmic protein
MKGFILGLILGVVVCAGLVWYLGSKPEHQEAGPTTNTLKNAAVETKDVVQQKVDSLNLSTTNIKAELANTGAIIRRKAQDAGQYVADATADTRITADIKGKLVADPNLSALSISVSTTDGLVTMSGAASSPENIRHAVDLAWNTDGVRGVVSTIQVRD